MRLFRYQIPLTAPIQLGNVRIEMREGLLLRHEAGARVSWGEAAPLPGFSSETLPQVIDAARQQAWGRYPSLQFAYDSLEFPPVAVRVAISALLMGERSELWRAVRRIRDLPHPILKLKVARGIRLEEEIDLVLALKQALRPDQRLRLDANRGWDYRQALSFARAIGSSQIEYIEEPTREPKDFERLLELSGVPYALDETLRETTDLHRFPQAAALIVKPTLQGGRDTIARLAADSRPLVFSSAFESGVGLYNIARAAALFAPQVPVGLDTFRWLTRDTVVPRFQSPDGSIEVPSAWQIDDTCLEELTC